MFKKVYILNVSGGHGHFLTFVLDKFCKDTPDIKESPFNDLGNSHNFYKQSRTFNFIDSTEVNEFVKNSRNKNLILITINNELLYFERIWLSRAGDTNTDLYSEEAISHTLKKYGSTFPAYCKEKNISLKDGYKFGFKYLDKNGVIEYDNNRKNIMELKNNNVIFFPVSNFFNLHSFEAGLNDMSKKFLIELDLTNLKEVYDQFYEKNNILKSHNNVDLYLKGDKSIKLDIIQQAYVDSLV
jgi:hypothetical protein